MNSVAVLVIFLGVLVNGISGFWFPLFSSTDAETARKATEDVKFRNLEAVDLRGQEEISSVPVIVMPEGSPEEPVLIDSEPVALESKDFYMDELEEEEEMFPPEPVALLPGHNMFEAVQPVEGSPSEPVVIEPERPSEVGEVGHSFVAAPEEPDVAGEFGSVFNDRVVTSISKYFDDYDY